MNLIIAEGITDSQIEELIHYSNNDPIILKTTSDIIRFGNIEAVKDWLKKKRKIYTLVDDANRLFGIVWFGEEKMPDAKYPIDFEPNKFEITFGIRIYGDVRGKGYSIKLFKESLKKYKQTDAYKQIENKNIWLTTNIDNPVAIALYKKLGFKEVLNDKSKNKLIMISSRS
jgi:ribosomal protein S18 acetylase RimI-like enzyme